MRILVVDDHLVVREGIARLLRAAIASLELHTASDAAEALSVYSARPFDVVIVDLNLPGADGFSLLQDLFACDDRVRVLVFSMHAHTGYAVRALRLGARGFVSKSAPAEELITAVKAIADGSRYIESHIAAAIALNEEHIDGPKLTERESEILRLIGEGKSIREIAVDMGRAYKTVSNTCGNIKAKLGVRRSVDLVRVSLADTRGREDA
jgi:DNA-binding NarL/FixJ family response regulator